VEENITDFTLKHRFIMIQLIDADMGRDDVFLDGDDELKREN